MSGGESLGAALDAIAVRLLQDGDITDAERHRWSQWLLERQILSGSNAGAFAPTPEDLSGRTRMFTGECLATQLASWNVLTAEAGRALTIFGRAPAVTDAVGRARQWLQLRCFAVRSCIIGECAHSFVAYLRFLNASETDPSGVTQRVNLLRSHRDGDGRWQRFPFYYTALTLTEISSDAARSELHYALPALLRVRNRGAKDEVYGVRRRQLVERILSLDELKLL